jgi:hypothetical protein
LTYRELQTMADGHQKAAWGHTLVAGLMVAKALGAKGPNIEDLIPERYRGVQPTQSVEDEAAAAELAFLGLECGLRAWSRESAGART